MANKGSIQNSFEGSKGNRLQSEDSSDTVWGAGGHEGNLLVDEIVPRHRNVRNLRVESSGNAYRESR